MQIADEGKPEKTITPAMENYLKAIYRIEQEGRQAETNHLSQVLGGIKPASITAMLKKLGELGLVNYAPYQGATLTPAGRKISLEVLRHHRLIELYLVEALGYTWDEVHEEAELLEHYVSEKLEARIAAKLGHPEFDPHGDPIPALDGSLPSRASLPLSECRVGAEVLVIRVLDQSADGLRFLASRGLVTEARLLVLENDALGGPVTVRAGSEETALERPTAAKILVVRAKKDE